MRTKALTCGAMTAALYVVLTYLTNCFGLANGVIQVRLSEALTILPVLLPTSATVWGLFIGCILSNAVTGCAVWDIIFGSLATLIGACGTYCLRKRPNLAWIPPVLANTVIVPQILRFVYHCDDAIWFLTLTVGAGELLSCGVGGWLVYRSFRKYKK